jgi:hypothetical protein
MVGRTSALLTSNNPYRYSRYMFDEESGLYHLKKTRKFHIM